jgi:hypothetical protein
MSVGACDVAANLTGMMLGAGFDESSGAGMGASLGWASGATLLGNASAKTGLGKREACESRVYSQDGEGSIACPGDRPNA